MERDRCLTARPHGQHRGLDQPKFVKRNPFPQELRFVNRGNHDIGRFQPDAHQSMAL